MPLTTAADSLPDPPGSGSGRRRPAARRTARNPGPRASPAAGRASRTPRAAARRPVRSSGSSGTTSGIWRSRHPWARSSRRRNGPGSTGAGRVRRGERRTGPGAGRGWRMNVTSFYAYAYKPGGDPYISTRGRRSISCPTSCAGPRVAAALMTLAREGNFNPTAAEIAARLPSSRGQAEGSSPGHRSISFVQKGLYAPQGREAHRSDPEAGRRFIDWVRGLKPKHDPKTTTPRAGRRSRPSPCTPSKENSYTTTTSPSSSSNESSPEKTGDPEPDVVRPLYELARQVVSGASFGAVAAAIKRFTADWVRKALKHREKQNRRRARSGRSGAISSGYSWSGRDAATRPMTIRSRKPQPVRKPAVDPSEEAQDKRFREAWGLLTEPQREEYRAEIRAEQPSLARNPTTLEALSRGRFADRMAAEEPRAP